jgi:hypothetical protein
LSGRRQPRRPRAGRRSSSLEWYRRAGTGLERAARGWSIYQALDLDRSTALGETLYLSAWFCSFAGFIAWYVEGGTPAVKDLARRCVRFRVPLRWWLVVLALPIVYQMAAFALHGVLAGGVGEFRPSAIADYWSRAGLALLLTGPLGEEGGWRRVHAHRRRPGDRDRSPFLPGSPGDDGGRWRATGESYP